MFHLGDYRRATVGPGQDVPDDYFFINGISGLLTSLFFFYCPVYFSLWGPGSCSRGPSTFVADLWLVLASASSVLLRQKILRKCREDIYRFYDQENGQIAIYDAVNPTATGRRSLAKEFEKHDVQVRIIAREALVGPGPLGGMLHD